FVSAQPPFLLHSLRKPYKALALSAGFVAGVVFDSLIGPLLLGAILALLKGTPADGISSLFGVVAVLKVASVLVGYLVSKTTVMMVTTQIRSSSHTSVRKDDASPA
ncbi:MAG: hypothetical protein AABM33_10195, partial [Pseudomonadota bacterium]